MQPQPPRASRARSTSHVASARAADAPLSDTAVLALLGGLYLGGLTAFVSTAYALSLLV